MKHHIISASVTEDVLKDIATLEKTGYAGRSEVLRAGVSLLAQQKKDREKLSGNIDAVLILKYAESHGDVVHELQHEFNTIIQTRLHNHLPSHTCMEVLILRGDATKVKQVAERCERIKGIMLAHMTVV